MKLRGTDDLRKTLTYEAHLRLALAGLALGVPLSIQAQESKNNTLESERPNPFQVIPASPHLA